MHHAQPTVWRHQWLSGFEEFHGIVEGLMTTVHSYTAILNTV